MVESNQLRKRELKGFGHFKLGVFFCLLKGIGKLVVRNCYNHSAMAILQLPLIFNIFVVVFSLSKQIPWNELNGK